MKVFEDLRGYSAIEEDVIQNFSTYVKKAKEDIKIIVIVGAWHGEEIDRFMKIYPKASFVAFEPYPKNYNILVERYKNNPKVVCLNYACSDFNGTADFHEMSSEGNGSLLSVSEKSIYNLKEIETVKVKVVKLDIVLKNLSVDLLWMDVQGNELNVLKGYKNNNSLGMFLEIQVEGYNHDSYEGNCYLRDLKEYLTDYELISIGLDNELKNGTGNSFWLKKGN